MQVAAWWVASHPIHPLWISPWDSIWSRKKFRYILVHEIVKAIGPRKSQALPMFYAYTGCNTVSAFATRGKKSAWDTWMAYEDVISTFLALSTAPNDICK